MTDPTPPRKIPAAIKTAAAAVAFVVGCVTFAGLRYGWSVMGGRMQTDFWPVDNSRVSTNVLAGFIQIGIAGGVMALVYPPFRRFLESEWEHMHAKVDHLIDLQHHIIEHHPDIPTHRDGVPLADSRPERGRPTG